MMKKAECFADDTVKCLVQAGIACVSGADRASASSFIGSDNMRVRLLPRSRSTVEVFIRGADLAALGRPDGGRQCYQKTLSLDHDNQAARRGLK